MKAAEDGVAFRARRDRRHEQDRTAPFLVPFTAKIARSEAVWKVPARHDVRRRNLVRDAARNPHFHEMPVLRKDAFPLRQLLERGRGVAFAGMDHDSAGFMPAARNPPGALRTPDGEAPLRVADPEGTACVR